MRAGALLALAALTACNDGAIDLQLLLPEESSDYDMTCVKAVDVLPLGPADTQPLDIGARTGNNATCIDLGRTVTTFAQLHTALSNTVDVGIPPGGLGAIEIRGRAGACADKPPQFEAIFYGGAQYSGTGDLTIPVARSLSCAQSAQFTVKPVNMYDLFNTKTCTDYIDPGSQAFSAEFRPTLIAHQPLTFETGASAQPMSVASVQLMSFNKNYHGTCAAVALQNTAMTIAGQTCINNAGAMTACAGTNVELPVLPTAYAQASRDTTMTKYEGWSFVGVWTTTGGTPGPVSGATVVLDPMEDAKVVFGDLGTTAFQPTAGATATTASGMFMVYTNDLVGLTVNANGKTSRHILVGADASHPSSSIVVLN